eukprot:Sdes_comp18343_c0_seq2m8088
MILKYFSQFSTSLFPSFFPSTSYLPYFPLLFAPLQISFASTLSHLMSSPRQIIFPFPDSWDPFCSSVKFSEPYEVGCFIKKSNTYTFGGEPVVTALLLWAWICPQLVFHMMVLALIWATFRKH